MGKKFQSQYPKQKHHTLDTHALETLATYFPHLAQLCADRAAWLRSNAAQKAQERAALSAAAPQATGDQALALAR